MVKNALGFAGKVAAPAVAVAVTDALACGNNVLRTVTSCERT
jgi:hypothetical protein